MRSVMVGLMVAIAGCATVETMTVPPEAGPEPVEDAGVDADVEASSSPQDSVCPGAPVSESCNAYGTTCGDGGARYGCFNGTCPSADAGSCTLLSSDPNTRYTEVCCQRIACARNGSFGDERCTNFYDAGAMTQWNCPWIGGKLAATPPGKCENFNGNPFANDSTAKGVTFCCK